ncbi:cell cycle checkpoint control protein RAD9A [Polypterus senegalus]|uniref:cell cycle checkpoint control protein RAD9A n=1 Tax=Polypterus senegalus TaxID=55291 RepID=UPI00196558C0|nr:cell cycle checkpoint control protein RAD9A [Polypterus senegalus]XP_039623473.1 cell cycle checkpoint control protein RAD9A [Polypterus senegalus]
MKCVVAGSNVKVLGKAVHSLSRIGDELYFEPVESGLALRTVNLSRSAYACFLFNPLFFQQYDAEAPKEDSQFRCKIAMKSVQAIFKSLSTLEKTVEKCRIDLNLERSRLVFQLLCKYGITKTHKLSFQECESLQAVFAKEECLAILKAQPKLLVDTVMNFPATLEEVNVTVTGERVLFRNHLEEEQDITKMMVTEMSIAADEFDHFEAQEDISITFCLKELRGLLSFAESSGLPINIYFNDPGRPVIFSLDDPVLEVNFVLATLSDEDTRPHEHTGAKKRCPPQADTTNSTFLSDDIDAYMIEMETTALEEKQELPADVPSCSTERGTHHALDCFQENSGSDTENEEDVPGTPPQKKFRSLFFGSVLSPASRGADQTLLNQEVLAEASDEDEAPK